LQSALCDESVIVSSAIADPLLGERMEASEWNQNNIRNDGLFIFVGDFDGIDTLGVLVIGVMKFELHIGD
jgi:hypothetical protein